MRKALLAMLVAAAGTTVGPAEHATASCAPALVPSRTAAYTAIVRYPAAAYRAPGRQPFWPFSRKNTNGYPMLFSVRGSVPGAGCRAAWYRVQLPLRPNGVTGYVPAGAVRIERVDTRIVADLSERRLTLFRRGRAVMRVVVGIGSPASPTPTGRFYVNQRLVPAYKAGPWGPAALGVSAFSPTLRSWTQGGPIAIHGTSDPASVGRAVSHGCLRVRNALMQKLYAATPAGTPVSIRP